MEGEVRTPTLFLRAGNTKKICLKAFEQVRVGFGYSTKGLEGVKIGYDITNNQLLPGMLQIGNFGTKVVRSGIIQPK